MKQMTAQPHTNSYVTDRPRHHYLQMFTLMIQQKAGAFKPQILFQHFLKMGISQVSNIHH